MYSYRKWSVGFARRVLLELTTLFFETNPNFAQNLADLMPCLRTTRPYPIGLSDQQYDEKQDKKTAHELTSLVLNG